jgi:hypothetical protein
MVMSGLIPEVCKFFIHSNDIELTDILLLLFQQHCCRALCAFLFIGRTLLNALVYAMLVLFDDVL